MPSETRASDQSPSAATRPEPVTRGPSNETGMPDDLPLNRTSWFVDDADAQLAFKCSSSDTAVASKPRGNRGGAVSAPRMPLQSSVGFISVSVSDDYVEPYLFLSRFAHPVIVFGTRRGPNQSVGCSLRFPRHRCYS